MRPKRDPTPSIELNRVIMSSRECIGDMERHEDRFRVIDLIVAEVKENTDRLHRRSSGSDNTDRDTINMNVPRSVLGFTRGAIGKQLIEGTSLYMDSGTLGKFHGTLALYGSFFPHHHIFTEDDLPWAFQ